MKVFDKNIATAWRGLPYIALEEVNFIWSLDNVLEFDQLWNEGFSLQYIADYFNRSTVEVGLLIMDRELKGKIGPRHCGIGGRTNESDQLQ